MKSKSLGWKTGDGLTIQAIHWPAQPAKAVICIVHGLGEHSGRYAEVATFFNKKNMAVLAADRRGHGRSEGKRGHISHYAALLDEIDLLLDKAAELYPESPIFLYGHSMGGNLALNYALKRRPKIRGVIATASWIRLDRPPSKLLVSAVRLLHRFFPAATIGNGLDIRELSSDKNVRSAYEADPLNHDRISFSTAIALLEAAEYLDRYAGPAPMPLLIMHGGADKITKPSGSEALSQRMSGDATLKVWDGLKHEIHHEPQKMEALSFISDWIEKRL